MNFNLYVFGTPESGYSQYPDDYSKELIEPFCKNVNGSQAVIYRHLDLIHYIFIEKLAENKLFGICIILNRLQAAFPKKLFSFLKEVVENQALHNRKFVEYNSKGDVAFKSDNFSEELRSYEFLKSVINAGLEEKADEFGFQELTTKYSGDNKTEYANFSQHDETIFNLSNTCDKVIIEVKNGLNNNHTHLIITGLQENIRKRDQEIAELKQDVEQLERKKKQYRKVIMLFIVLLISCVGLIFLYNTLTETERDLQNTTEQLYFANQEIDRQQFSIDSLNTVVDGLNSTITHQQNRITDLSESLEEAQSEINDAAYYMPIIITSSDFGWYSGYLTCKYYALRSKNVSLTFLVKKNGTEITTKHYNLSIDSGRNEFTVYLKNSLNSSHYYDFEVKYDGRTIYSARK